MLADLGIRNDDRSVVVHRMLLVLARADAFVPDNVVASAALGPFPLAHFLQTF